MNLYQSQYVGTNSGDVAIWLEKLSALGKAETFENGDLILCSLSPPSVSKLKLNHTEIVNLSISGKFEHIDSIQTLEHIADFWKRNELAAELWLSVLYQQPGTRQTKTTGDRLSLYMTTEEWGISWWGRSASRVKPEKHHNILSSIISSSDLPLRVIAKGETFGLERTKEGKLQLSACLEANQSRPAVFLSETEIYSEAALHVDHMRRILKAIKPKKYYYISWKLTPTPLAENVKEISEEIVRVVSENPRIFQADSYELKGDLRLLEISALDSLRPLCGKDDRILTSLGYVRNFEGDAVNVEVETRADGHRLVLESKGTIDVYKFEEIFGVKFERDD